MDRFRIELIQQRLREVIKQSSLTQKEIAKAIGVSPQTVSKYMKHNVFPALDTLAKICFVLDCDSNYILGLVDF